MEGVSIREIRLSRRWWTLKRGLNSPRFMFKIVSSFQKRQHGRIKMSDFYKMLKGFHISVIGSCSASHVSFYLAFLSAITHHCSRVRSSLTQRWAENYCAVRLTWCYPAASRQVFTDSCPTIQTRH